MCIIMFQKKGNARFPREWLDEAAKSNSDGGGIMWAHKNKLHTYRALDDLDGLWRRYCNARDVGAPVGLHFRIRTHGDVSTNNCHPFILSQESASQSMALMHNGIVGDLGSLPEGWSDTRYFVDAVVSKLPLDFLHNDAMREVVQRGASGKYLFMSADAWWMILRHEQGNWNEGKTAWFSNSSYRPWKSMVSSTYGSIRRSGDVWDRKNRKWITQAEKDAQDSANITEAGDSAYEKWWADRQYGRGHARACCCATCCAMRQLELAAEKRKDGKFVSEIEGADKTRELHLAGASKFRKADKICGWCGGEHDRSDDIHKSAVLHAIYKRQASTTERWSENELETGALWNGMVCCWDCIEDHAVDRQLWEITLPVATELICAWCDEILYDPSEHKEKSFIQL